ncbi:hypothetical protein [Ramlibacter sp. PS4R-6]|uniref:hypothetical protein n=1 Tax=Ramlibacter sp. PS4R-6 TaxID=3133438 RepID=UPI00309761EE
MTRAWTLALATTALATVAAAASAQAVRVERYVYEQPRYYAQGETHESYEPGYRHDHRRYDCRAPRWDPNARYMPGQAVWRNGKFYVATDVSASVYNVNSPPEWTPNYWVQVRCRR